ncbi:MAG: riboflavin synthase [Clostridiales bacterium]|nr:riboflavin synthase [Clostridiales bacterium]
MFTGLTEAVGTLKGIGRGTDCAVLEIDNCFGDIKIGDSVAVNGVCLTACRVEKKSFFADVMPETMHRSNLGILKIGSRVNLERAMRADSRFGGHIVTGHIDCTAILRKKENRQNAVWLEFSVPDTSLIVEKGSVAIDGISLTVASVTKNSFAVSIIPHTAENTTLANKRTGDIVNIEFDIIGKYVKKLTGTAGGITEEFLRENGF